MLEIIRQEKKDKRYNAINILRFSSFEETKTICLSMPFDNRIGFYHDRPINLERANICNFCTHII